MKTLGDLRNVNVRERWKNEAQDFTPWLAEEENIRLLGNALGIELEVENTEVAVGPYSADILAKDSGTDKYVVIENQLEKTDHDHLGKAITYASALDASAVVWIASTFTEEHQRALTWLNDHTSEDVAFYGVKLELWQIDESHPAVRFNVISKPVDIVRQAAIKRAAGDLTEVQRLQLDFWTEFREALLKTNKVPSAQMARPQYWFDVALGRSGINLSNTCNTYDNRIGIRVYISNKVADVALPQLLRDKEEIEAEIGENLEWNPNPENRDKVIVLTRDAELVDRALWDQYIDWMVEMTLRFRKAFAPRVKKLILTREDRDQREEVSTDGLTKADDRQQQRT